MQSVDYFHPLVLLIVLLISGAWCLARPSAPASAVLAGLSMAWFFFNQPIEGKVLWNLDVEHGLTESDLLVFAGLGLSAVTLWRVRRS